MTSTVKSTQVLYTSADYVQAINTAGKIEKTISLIEGGKATVDFSRYMKAYSDLLERVVATNDLGHNNNPNMRFAHKKLTDKLQGLDKRAAAVCAKTGIAPHSKELIEMLKADEEPPMKPESEWAWDKWTWTDITKYSAGGIVAVVAAPQLWNLATRLEGLALTSIELSSVTIPTVVRNTEETLKVAQVGLEVLGNGVNVAKKIGADAGFTTSQALPPTQAGIAFVLQAGAAQVLGNTLTPFAKLVFPERVANLIPSVLVATSACNSIIPDFTKIATDGIEKTVHYLKRPFQTYPAQSLLASILFITDVTYNRDDIRTYLDDSSKWQYIGYGASLLLSGALLEQLNPGLFEQITSGITFKVTDTIAPVLKESFEANPWSATISSLGTALAVGHTAIPVLGPLVGLPLAMAAGATASPFTSSTTMYSVPVGSLAVAGAMVGRTYLAKKSERIAAAAQVTAAALQAANAQAANAQAADARFAFSLTEAMRPLVTAAGQAAAAAGQAAAAAGQAAAGQAAAVAAAAAAAGQAAAAAGQAGQIGAAAAAGQAGQIGAAAGQAIADQIARALQPLIAAAPAGARGRARRLSFQG